MKRHHHPRPPFEARFRGHGFPGDMPGFGGPWFGPGPGRGHGGGRARKGDVRSVILVLLADGPSNGYGLIKAIAEKTSGMWRPSPGSVYPTLQQLVDEGLVEAAGGGKRTEYSLSDAGREYAAEHEPELAGWDTVQRPSDATRTLFESVGRLMGVLGQYRHAASDEQRALAATKVDELRRALYLILAE